MFPRVIDGQTGGMRQDKKDRESIAIPGLVRLILPYKIFVMKNVCFYFSLLCAKIYSSSAIRGIFHTLPMRNPFSEPFPNNS